MLTCSTASSAGQLRVTDTLNYVQRWYKCESTGKSTLTANWTISVPFTPTYFSVDTSVDTWGNVEITAPGGGSPLTHTSIYGPSSTEFKMRYLGNDPVCNNNKMYEVTYNFDNVPDSYFGSGAVIKASISIAGTCSLLGNVVTSGSVTAPTLSNDSYLPCDRIDQVFINPYMGPGGCATATGNYVLCSYPSGFLLIDNHQLEYRVVNSGTGSLAWSDQSSTVHGGVPTGLSTESQTIDPSTGVSNLVGITSGATWLIRYRNIKNSTCNLISGYNQNWGSEFTWIVEVWVL